MDATAIVDDAATRSPDLLRAALALAGAAAVLASAGAELVGTRNPGIGPAQIGLALAGFTALLVRDWLASSAPDRTRDLVRHLAVAVQLGMLVLVIAGWQLEGPGMHDRIAPLAFYGFLLHHALPARLRPGFFLLLSLIGLFLVLGASATALVVAIGALVIGTCHLPIPMRGRILMLVVLGTALALSRAGLVPVEPPLIVWPVLGSMFMFRIIAYLYDLRHGNAPTGLAQRLSYFFMLPNAVFPLFPVVDPSAWHRRYYDAPSAELYQRGVGWMLRGALHLVAYRVIYQRLALAPAEVATTTDLAVYMVTTFGLYLRVSGQFHLIVGMLHLFGHGLPETHRAYFLASSFTDFWRRINIYWKDFIQKVVYMPAFFALRKGRSETATMIIATLVAFFATWALHSYQWFWLLGRPLLSAPDVLFWSVLAVLVLVDSLRERRQGRIRKLHDRGFSAREALTLGLRTAATFLVMTVLWTIWTSSSTQEWLALLAVADPRTGEFWLLLAGLFGGAVLIAAVARFLSGHTVRLGDTGPGRYGPQVAMAALGIAALLVTSRTAVTRRLPLEAQQVLFALQRGDLSARDAERLQRGYYENLIGVSALNSRLWEVYAKRPDDWLFIHQTPAGRSTTDFMEKELVPGAEILWHGKPFRVNRWGMRDRDYERVPAPGTRRIALFGASYTIGSGVGDGDAWESLIEDRLNRERPAGIGPVEVLNFAAPGYVAFQHLLLLDRRALDLAPTAVWVVSYPDEGIDLGNHIERLRFAGVPMPWPYLDSVIQRAGLTPDMSREEVRRRLRPFARELFTWTMREIAARCRARGIAMGWIYLPATRAARTEDPYPWMEQVAREAGFATAELRTVYEGHAMEDIIVAPYDFHPNERGHQIIADMLYPQIARPGFLGAPAGARTAP